MICVGALLYDEIRKKFGLVAKMLDEDADTWYITWSDGRESWIFGKDLYKFIESARRLRE